VPYWASKGVQVSINGNAQQVTAEPASYLTLDHAWKVDDVITVDIPMTMHLNTTPDDKQVQAAMYGPLVLAARMGTEGLTNSMIYGSLGPFGGDDGYPMPHVDLRPREDREADTKLAATPLSNGVWFERAEGSLHYPLQFRTLGHGPIHTLVPLNQLKDERYSVYLRNLDIA
jgi:hypothetical protein